MLDFFRTLSGPVTMHLELTEACPERCRHCYNFVRDPDYRPKSASKEDITFFLEDFKRAGGFHVIFTGGEPLIEFDKLLHATETAVGLGLSVSLNSNLMLAKVKQMKRLKQAGIDHVLTTLFSNDPVTHDYIASRDGSHKAILKGIQQTQAADIRVSVNMIMTNVNDAHVYDTGKFLHSLGHNKFIANRMIPSNMNSNSLKKEFLIKPMTAKRMLSDLIRLNEELDMTVGTCRALPHCFLGDIDKHFAFVARGCNAGKRHMLVGVDGTGRACVHESDTYGNVKQDGILKVWKTMEKWRRKDLLPGTCQKCSLLALCEGACRQIAEVCTGAWSGEDNLCTGEAVTEQYYPQAASRQLENIEQMMLSVNPDIRFRKEEGAYLVNILGAKCVLVENKFAEFLKDHQERCCHFKHSHFPDQNMEELGLYLMYDIVRKGSDGNVSGTVMEPYFK